METYLYNGLFIVACLSSHALHAQGPNPQFPARRHIWYYEVSKNSGGRTPSGFLGSALLFRGYKVGLGVKTASREHVLAITSKQRLCPSILPVPNKLSEDAVSQPAGAISLCSNPSW